MISLEEYFKENFAAEENALITVETTQKFIEEPSQNVTELMTVSLEDYFKSTLTSTSQKFMEKTSENVIVTSFATNNGSINNKIKRDFLKFSIDLKDGYNILYLILFILLITLCNLVIFVWYTF